jgi:hypothetical protein
MRNLGLILLAALVLALPATAQTKITGKANCAKADTQQSVDVGDVAGHSISVVKNSCKWDTPLEIAGLKSGDAVDVSTIEAWGPKFAQHGYNTSTMDNGDKMTVRYSGTATAAKDGTLTMEGKWTFLKGTGKLKGIKGSGTYKGTGATDGSGIVDVEGEYTLPEAKTAAKPAS